MSILLTAILTAPMIACGADLGEAGDSLPPKTIVFFGGCKTHAPGAHEHLRGAQLLKQCLDTAPGIAPLRTRIYLDTWPQDPGELDDAATIVLTWEGWGLHLVNGRHPERAQKLDQLMKRGVGLVCFHAATAVEKSVESYYLDWVGGNKSPDYSLHPMARGIDVSLADPQHALCRGVGPMKFAEEEFYCKILFRRRRPTCPADPDGNAPARAAGETGHRLGGRAGGWRTGLCLYRAALPCEFSERRFAPTGAQRDPLDGQD